MNKLLTIILLGVLFFSACSKVTFVDGPTEPLSLGEGTRMLTYEPKQCDKTPWETWYELQDLGPNLSEDDQIKLYYNNVHAVLDMTLTNEQAYEVVCEACSICPRGNKLTVIVYKEQANIFVEDGWTLVE